MDRRRSLLAASMPSGGGGGLTFPIYLTSVEGKGKNRTVEPNSDILLFIEYADKVGRFDSLYWYLPLSSDDIIFVIDGIPFYVAEGYDSNGQWRRYQLYEHSSNTISGWWYGAIERNGYLYIWDDE